jgi:hypothetical protein
MKVKTVEAVNCVCPDLMENVSAVIRTI